VGRYKIYNDLQRISTSMLKKWKGGRKFTVHSFLYAKTNEEQEIWQAMLGKKTEEGAAYPPQIELLDKTRT
jgi:hypothetical protein